MHLVYGPLPLGPHLLIETETKGGKESSRENPCHRVRDGAEGQKERTVTFYVEGKQP